MNRLLLFVFLGLAFQHCGIAGGGVGHRVVSSQQSNSNCCRSNRVRWLHPMLKGCVTPKLDTSACIDRKACFARQTLPEKQEMAPAVQKLLDWKTCDTKLLSAADLDAAFELCELLHDANINCIIFSIGRSHEILVPKSDLTRAADLSRRAGFK